MPQLVLRDARERDEAAVRELLQDPEVMRFLGPRRALDDGEAQQWFQHALRYPSRYAVALADTDELVGFCGVKRLDGALDFGYFLRRRFWGRGLATEACLLVLNKLSAELDLAELEIFIAEANHASRRVAAKLGWRVVGESDKDGEPGHRYRACRPEPERPSTA